MGRNIHTIPATPIARLIKERYALRVSKKATELLARYIQQRGGEVAASALELSDHAGRNTILDRDVHMAKRK